MNDQVRVSHLRSELLVGAWNVFKLILNNFLQVLGELPLTKCRLALEAVNLVEPPIKDGTTSLLADTIAHLGQEVRSLTMCASVLTFTRRTVVRQCQRAQKWVVYLLEPGWDFERSDAYVPRGFSSSDQPQISFKDMVEGIKRVHTCRISSSELLSPCRCSVLHFSRFQSECSCWEFNNWKADLVVGVGSS